MEKSAIDLIYEMHETIQNMNQKIEMMEKNLNLLQDKTNGRLMEAIVTELPKGHLPVASKVKDMPLPPAGPEKKSKVQTSTATPRQNVKVVGKFVDGRTKPIPGIEVTIVDANNQVVKQTKTNRAGRWMCYLPVGQYSAEFIKEGMNPTFKVFDVLEGQREIEVA